MTKPSAFSLFSGAGGFCEGIRLAGWDVKGAVELDRFAAQTYRHNFPEVPFYEGDVTDSFTKPEWSGHEDLDTVVPGSIDLLFGGPPCQGYSQIGPRSLDDPRNKLYREYIRVLNELRAPLFIMENVPNMLLLAQGQFKKQTLAAFRKAGYSNVGVTIVKASDYGVPQARERAIFFGVSDDYDLGGDATEFLVAAMADEKRDGVSVKEAVGDLPKRVSLDDSPLRYPKVPAELNPFLREMRLDTDGEFYSSELKRSRAGTNELHNHHTKDIQERRANLIRQLKPGMKADSLPKDVWDGARPEKWRRFDPDQPAHTILAQMHRDLSEWIHYKHHRWITVREAARLQSFHDGFVFQSSEWQMLKQVGNAVPPLMARALGAMAQSAAEQVKLPAAESPAA